MKIEGIEYSTGTARHPWLCRWWLRTRPTTLGIQLGPPGVPPCVEFYVPWWAWPLELVHRAVFGFDSLEPIGEK